MVARHTDSGFTIVEVLVTLVVMSVFLLLLFQTYIANIAQQKIIVMRSAADDIATTNLKKIRTRNSTLLSSITCGPSNDLTAATPGAGSAVTFTPESITATDLPSTTTQTLTVFYPQGCSPAGTVPIQVVSIVTYGTESVRHATYIN